jgi:hypothetical protein
VPVKFQPAEIGKLIAMFYYALFIPEALYLVLMLSTENIVR